jgi:hypothetical protein
VDIKPSNLLKLDPSPSFEEEVRDFGNPDAYSGAKPFDGEAAKTRIDSIARRLAIVWTAFLAYIILAEGLKDGWEVSYQNGAGEWSSFYLIRPFHLEGPDFIAVVTTTTISVFGFLVIVANHLFHREKKGGSDL